MKHIYQFSFFAFILGIICALICPTIFPHISFLGTIYINALKLMIVPVLFFSICTTIGKNIKSSSKITIKSIALFIVMYAVSFIISWLAFSLIKPGVGFNFIEVEWTGELVNTSLTDFVTSIFPSNIIAAMSTNAILPVILFAFIFGIALSKTKSNNAINLMSELSNSFNKMLEYFMCLTPIGVFALIGNTVASYGKEIIGSFAIYIGSAYLGCFLIAVLVMILPVWIFAKINPITYIKKVASIWVTTMSTCSSAATLPATIKVCNEKFNIPQKITDIIVPLGCTIHMCGGAVSFCLLMLFCLQMYSIPVTFGLFALGLFCSLIINMGAPGIPGGGIVIGATFLSILGIPLTFIGVYSGIYKILDMAYTTMNVTGDITANILISHYTKD